MQEQAADLIFSPKDGVSHKAIISKKNHAGISSQY
jgi:hypothetical protein